MPLVAAFCSDSAALFTGMACGRHKMAPLVSPHKTVEGALGGIAGGVVGMVIFRIVFYFCTLVPLHILISKNIFNKCILSATNFLLQSLLIYHTTFFIKVNIKTRILSTLPILTYLLTNLWLKKSVADATVSLIFYIKTGTLYKNKNIVGATSIILSHLSRIPP